MAGLLAGNMLRWAIQEAKESLPNNHSAVLRFRSTLVGDVLGIPFREVTLLKHVLSTWDNPIADALSYSYKCTGVRRSDRSIIKRDEVAKRYIAPPDLIQRMAQRCDIIYGSRFVAALGAPFISTIPMPDLMAALDYKPRPVFMYRPGWNITATIDDCDAYVSLLIPDEDVPIARISITGNQLIVECYEEPEDTMDIAVMAADFLGIKAHNLEDITMTNQAYGKIVPILEEERRDFIYWASTYHNIYSLGRFATWRPGLLLDDLVNDIRLIERWVNGDQYARKRLA